MPSYSFKCKSCDINFSIELSREMSCVKQNCPECMALCGRELSKTNFMLKGDGWIGKNQVIKDQMKDKNKFLEQKQNEKKRDAPGMTLAPNIGGEKVDSWADAQKIAKEKGLNTASYDALVKKEASK